MYFVESLFLFPLLCGRRQTAKHDDSLSAQTSWPRLVHSGAKNSILWQRVAWQRVTWQRLVYFILKTYSSEVLPRYIRKFFKGHHLAVTAQTHLQNGWLSEHVVDPSLMKTSVSTLTVTSVCLLFSCLNQMPVRVCYVWG